MPKIKTNKSLMKRLKIKRKKILRKSPNQAHFRSVKSGQEKREGKGMKRLSGSLLKKVKGKVKFTK